MRAIARLPYFRPVAGAVLSVFCGLLLWGTDLGDWWKNASFDYQFLFSSRAVTNQVVLIQMDNESYDYLKQERYDPQHKEGWQPWDRKLHAQLLRKLAEGGAQLVVIDSFFRAPRDAAGDEALIEALRRQSNVVLMAEQAEVVSPRMEGVQPIYPAEIFLEAARTNSGVAWFDPDSDLVVRKHWPFPSPGPSTPAQFHSLPWVAASLAGARGSTIGQQ
jgi:CHASE2 domain-containing sensor protein